MKVRFKGMVTAKTKGCGCSGKTKTTGFSTTWKAHLPSGRIVTFRQGKIEDVLPIDAEYLLTEEYTLNGRTKKAFEVVDDGRI